MNYTGAKLLLDCLKQEGVETLFGYPGGAVLPIYDALATTSGLKHILVRHEQAAVHAADGWARACGRPGVVLATSGPGATNLLTGLATALADSVPLVAITGQVPLPLMGTDAFQETDILGASLPFTKFSCLVRTPEELPLRVREAFQRATSGRPGPVLLDVPKDVSAAMTQARPLPPTEGREAEPEVLPDVGAAVAMLSGAERPVLYVGGGSVRSGCTDLVRRLSADARIPVTTTLMALGTMHPDAPMFLGMPGMHGTRRANHALGTCDVLLAVGARFDDRVTGNARRFSPNSKRIVIDTDAGEFGKVCRADVRLHGDAAAVLRSLASGLAERKQSTRASWHTELLGHSASPPIAGVFPKASMRPEDIFGAINDVLPYDALVATDVGQHQMWAAQLLRHRRPGAFITSGGMGTMGYGLPAAIGAKLACPNVSVLVVVGDGGFQMTAHELSTLARYDIGVVVLIIDNQCLGMVRQWQQLFHGRRYSEVDLSDNPDFVAMAAAMGVNGAVAADAATLSAELTKGIEANRPYLIHVPIYRELNVFPIVPPGQPATTMLDSEEG